MMIVEQYAALRLPERLREVARLGLDRERDRPYLQEIVDDVADRLDTVLALVDVLLNDAQIIVAGHGAMPAWIARSAGFPAEWGFCRSFLSAPQPLVIPDLTVDPLFKDSPLVTIEGARSYIGVPLISRTGHVLGGLCALDLQPRQFESRSVAMLQRHADDVIERIEAEAD